MATCADNSRCSQLENGDAMGAENVKVNGSACSVVNEFDQTTCDSQTKFDEDIRKTSTPNKQERNVCISSDSPRNVAQIVVDTSNELNGAETSQCDDMPESLEYSIPILDYEVMEERTRFTVFKIRVEHQPSGQTWFVFRRYTDFVRLNKKLKVLFKNLRLVLPPKRWFGNNFDPIFLEDRLLGLQAYITNILKHKEISQCKLVRDFFCLDDPPDPHDSIEESRAFCANLEDTVRNLKYQLKDKDCELEYLRAEIAMLKSQLSSLVQSLKLECALTSYAHMQSCKHQSFDMHCNSGDSENRSSQLLQLHNLNLAIAQMIESSLIGSSDESTDIEVGLDATILCPESYPSCSNLLAKQVLEANRKSERTVGDGCTGIEERPTPLGSVDELPNEISNTEDLQYTSNKKNTEVLREKSNSFISSNLNIIKTPKCIELKQKLPQTVPIPAQPLCTS
ncbi:uncharacterized protein LOC111619292 [Centruroides sculpturatus]|uniref:uncharacterized protein LOC111619292 n=1 Tax=Centruroides sculpturatus TaxID=218467 RepID=UPI000C6CC47D|nr:uncharacterized protein LOC111619292 [Centruroides sculpturatus]XP_023216751.1 uncharacterized protein LOC111619292 [Centruroides sculpturatus]XP_023216752.1 uncharacterized protein LOC111619292 [Centruroides sculpturatus]